MRAFNAAIATRQSLSYSYGLENRWWNVDRRRRPAASRHR